jgi:hypothetical protein
VRARNIKPGLYRNLDLAELPIEARYLFPGLWMMADRDGRFPDDPKKVKAEIFPFDREIGVGKVHLMLQQLVDAGFLLRYEVDGAKFVQIIAFEKHQKPHPKEKPSDIPPPKVAELNGKPCNYTANPSDVLIADVLNPDVLIADGAVKGTVAAGTIREVPPQPPRTLSETEWPKTTKAIQVPFPATDGPYIMGIIHAAIQSGISAGADSQEITDRLLAEAVKTAIATGRVNGAGLLRKMVPTIVATWAKQ